MCCTFINLVILYCWSGSWPFCCSSCVFLRQGQLSLRQLDREAQLECEDSDKLYVDEVNAAEDAGKKKPGKGGGRGRGRGRTGKGGRGGKAKGKGKKSSPDPSAEQETQQDTAGEVAQVEVPKDDQGEANEDPENFGSPDEEQTADKKENDPKEAEKVCKPKKKTTTKSPGKVLHRTKKRRSLLKRSMSGSPKEKGTTSPKKAVEDNDTSAGIPPVSSEGDKEIADAANPPKPKAAKRKRATSKNKDESGGSLADSANTENNKETDTGPDQEPTEDVAPEGPTETKKRKPKEVDPEELEKVCYRSKLDCFCLFLCTYVHA